MPPSLHLSTERCMLHCAAQSARRAHPARACNDAFPQKGPAPLYPLRTTPLLNPSLTPRPPQSPPHTHSHEPTPPLHAGCAARVTRVRPRSSRARAAPHGHIPLPFAGAHTSPQRSPYPRNQPGCVSPPSTRSAMRAFSAQHGALLRGVGQHVKTPLPPRWVGEGPLTCW